jgi:N-acetylgalactosamine-N,N'-diacetylbacillosaminyl-diphospho-undecaprenol 4-alpha-N-acetylgalactosaminyltransferase
MALLFPIYIVKFKLLLHKYHPYKAISFLEISNFINILSNEFAIISFRTSLSFFNKDLFDNIYLFLIKKLYPKAEKIIVNSKENTTDLSNKLNISLSKIYTIYNPMDISKISNSKKQLINFSQFPQDKTIFITIGRLDKQKNIPILIKLFTTNSPQNAILLILGDGPEKDNLQKLIKDANLTKKVFLLGKIKNIFPYLKLSNYFIFSSKVEGFPNALIEAVFCNLPIITSDFKTGAREVIDEKLDYTQKIKYPYYGPNGVLLSIDNFITDFTKINFDKLHQNQQNIERFNIKNINNQWINIIEEEQ